MKPITLKQGQISNQNILNEFNTTVEENFNATVNNENDTFDSMPKVLSIVSLTQEEYDALTEIDPNTLYFTF